MTHPKTALVMSAHAADFVWRCGGAIALHAAMGYRMTVVCLSFGERGESAKLWKQPGMTLQKVKNARRAEAEHAATALGVHDLITFDLGDYPLEMTRDDKNRANHFQRNSGGQSGGRASKYAEGFQSVFPRTVDEL
jgi:4-oxalomesaconate hydratase